MNRYRICCERYASGIGFVPTVTIRSKRNASNIWIRWAAILLPMNRWFSIRLSSIILRVYHLILKLIWFLKYFSLFDLNIDFELKFSREPLSKVLLAKMTQINDYNILWFFLTFFEKKLNARNKLSFYSTAWHISIELNFCFLKISKTFIA